MAFRIAGFLEAELPEELRHHRVLGGGNIFAFDDAGAVMRIFGSEPVWDGLVLLEEALYDASCVTPVPQ